MPIEYRKEALERLQSPEQLDQFLRVTSPRAWLALAIACVLVGTALVWGVYGQVSTTVVGVGVIVRVGGLVDAVAMGTGYISQIKVRVGDVVQEGQLVATMVDPDLEEQLRTKKDELAELKQDHLQQAKLMDRETAAEREVLRIKRGTIEEDRLVLKNRRKWLDLRIAALTKLFQQGLVTEKQLADLRWNRDNTLVKIAKAHKDLRQVSERGIALEQKRRTWQVTKQLQIDGVKRRIQILQERRDYASRIVSPMVCRVVELRVGDGDMIKEGQPVLSGERVNTKLEMAIYATAYQGKMVEPSMRIRFTPATVKREEYGYMLGDVTSVSEYPVSEPAMMRMLKNRDLVQSLLKKGPVLSVLGDFEPDPTTRSGYKWSSLKGAHTDVTSGTLGSAEMVVKRQAPLTLVVPILKRWIGI